MITLSYILHSGTYDIVLLSSEFICIFHLQMTTKLVHSRIHECKYENTNTVDAGYKNISDIRTSFGETDSFLYMSALKIYWL